MTNCTRCDREFEPTRPEEVVCATCIMKWVMQICANCGRNIEQDDGDSMCTCTEEEREAALKENDDA